jgi:hypothetical protein
MRQLDPDGTQAPPLLPELRDLLIGEGVTEGVNLHLSCQDDVVLVQLMAVDVRRLGLLLAALSDPAELADPGSLSRRITPGSNDGANGRWQFELISGRYPAGGEIVFSATIRLPASDLPEIIARLR